MRLSFVAILFIAFSNVYALSAVIDDRSTNNPLTIFKRGFALDSRCDPHISPDYRKFVPQKPDDPGIERRFEKGKPRSPGVVDADFNGLPVVIERSHWIGGGHEFNSELKKLEQEQQLVAWQSLLRTSHGYIVKLPPQQEHDNPSSNLPRQDTTFIYRKAFTDAEEQEIEKQFKAGKQRKGNFGPKVVTKFQGLPVVIKHFEKEFEDSKEKRNYFISTLKNYERERRLVRWTSTYFIVKVRKCDSTNVSLGPGCVIM